MSDAAAVGADVNIGGSALAVIWTLIGISAVIVGARIWTQWRVTYQLGLSDGLVILSLATISTMAILISIQYHYGWGRHYVYLHQPAAMEALRYNAISQTFGVMGSTLGRMSFIVLMIQLFGTTIWRQRLLWGLFAAQLIFNGIVVVCLYVQCKDVRSLWDFTLPADCWNADVQTYLGYAHTAFNGLTDLFLTGLPATMLWNLQMKTSLKIGLCALLSLSLFAFAAVMMKIVKLKALSERGDYTYNTVQLFIWVITEGCLVDIASSIPLIRPFFTKSRLNRSNNTYEMKDLSNQRGTTTSRAFRDYDTKALRKLSDDGSQEGILPAHSKSSTIFKQTSYAVEYDVEDSRTGR